MDVSQAFVPVAACCAPTDEAGLKFPARHKLNFWRFERVGIICFLEVTGRSTSGVWRFNLAQFAGSGRVKDDKLAGCSADALSSKSSPIFAGRRIGKRGWNVGTEVGLFLAGWVGRKGEYGARLEPL